MLKSELFLKGQNEEFVTNIKTFVWDARNMIDPQMMTALYITWQRKTF